MSPPRTTVAIRAGAARIGRQDRTLMKIRFTLSLQSRSLWFLVSTKHLKGPNPPQHLLGLPSFNSGLISTRGPLALLRHVLNNSPTADRAFSQNTPPPRTPPSRPHSRLGNSGSPNEHPQTGSTRSLLPSQYRSPLYHLTKALQAPGDPLKWTQLSAPHPPPPIVRAGTPTRLTSSEPGAQPSPSLPAGPDVLSAQPSSPAPCS